MISSKAIKEFKKIYYKEFGIKISNKLALTLGQNLLNLYKAIYKPTIKDENEKQN